MSTQSAMPFYNGLNCLYIPTIDGWLEADRKIARKQRHTVERIYDRLRDECDFSGSYSSVKKYVRKKKFVRRRKPVKLCVNAFHPLVKNCVHKMDLRTAGHTSGLALLTTLPPAGGGMRAERECRLLPEGILLFRPFRLFSGRQI